MRTPPRSPRCPAGLLALVVALSSIPFAGTPARAEVTPRPAHPQATQSRHPVLATGTVAGEVYVHRDPSNAPYLLGNSGCKNLVAKALKNGNVFRSVKATQKDSPGSTICLVTFDDLPVGTYHVRLSFAGAGLPPGVQDSAKVEVESGAAAKPVFNVDWPVEPTGVVISTVKAAGIATCSGVHVTVKHELGSTVQSGDTTAYGDCSYHFNYIPLGSVTVSAESPPGFGVPAQTGTVDGVKAFSTTFAWPQPASITVRLHGADYPATIPNLDCSPFLVRASDGGVLVGSQNFGGASANDRDCVTQLSKLPSGKPLTLELTKNGQVVHTETVTLVGKNDLVKEIVALP
jgi:hypothetical protein